MWGVQVESEPIKQRTRRIVKKTTIQRLLSIKTAQLVQNKTFNLKISLKLPTKTEINQGCRSQNLTPVHRGIPSSAKLSETYFQDFRVFTSNCTSNLKLPR